MSLIANESYRAMYMTFSGYHTGDFLSFPMVAAVSVTAGLLAMVVYSFFAWYGPNYRIRFLVWGIGFVLLSLTGPLASNLPDGNPVPDGFAALAIPMHVVTGAICLFMMLRFGHKRSGQPVLI